MRSERIADQLSMREKSEYFRGLLIVMAARRDGRKRNSGRLAQ